MDVKIKNYADSYLYQTGNFEKIMVEFMMKAEVINKDHPSFEDIRYEVKRRQVTSSLMKVLDSKNIVLLRGNVGLSRAFKVFGAKDIISRDMKTKVFIDVTDIIKSTDGNYSIDSRNVDTLVAYLLNAMNTLIYYSTQPNKLLNNTTLIDSGTQAFADMLTYIIDYLRVGAVENVRERTKYLSALYYQCGILCKEFTDSTRVRARKISGLSQRECDIVETLMGPEPFNNIDTFIKALSKVLRIDGQLKLDNFIEKWAYIYGSGTQYGTELYPAFAAILTNAYVGSYINNQKTIEKVLGRTLVEFTNAIFKVGSELA
jgi:hypothetical protein